LAAQARRLQAEAKNRLNQDTLIKAFYVKFTRDNLGSLAAILAWNLLTSLVPITVGLLAISGYVLRADPSAQHSVVTHLSQALRGVLTPRDLQNLVDATVNHRGLLGIIGLVGVFWGGSSVGGAISTTFQAIFEVKGRNFAVEKLIDIAMIFVITALLVIVVLATAAGAVVTRLISGFPLSGFTTFILGTAISLVAAFLLFAAIYLVFPHVKPRFKIGNVWKGALTAAILFEILSYIWPIYAHFAHFTRYGAVLVPILVLTAWIYFFSVILLVGAEVVAIGAIREAQKQGQSVGPVPGDTVPQHEVLREGT
jgi:YihY family inner membrane protein